MYILYNNIIYIYIIYDILYKEHTGNNIDDNIYVHDYGL